MSANGGSPSSVRPSHKAWRRIAKRERRRRVRRKAARERDADEERLRATLERSAEYLNWAEQQERLSRERETNEEEERARREKLWLEEEARAQSEWRVLQKQKEKEREEQLARQAKIREEYQTRQEAIRKRKEEAKRREEEEIKRQEELRKQIDDYIDNGVKTPEALREAIDSQPGKELCPFFTKTGACRYGDSCSRNHRRVCLSNVILVPGFYTHFSLEKNSAEYDTDIGLEFESSETRHHFREFYKDVVPELESFGRIKTLKYCCNTEIHLRGNLYVEYYAERDAARALRRLKGRWYAGRQLNCEFANIQSWRSAVCGMSKCPKGRACNFLHTFKNPHDEYDIKSPPRWARSVNNQDSANSRRSERRTKSKWEETDRSTNDSRNDSRNWRWSESPEIELESQSVDTEKHRRRHEDRDRRHRSRHDSRRSSGHKSNRQDSRKSRSSQSGSKRDRSRSPSRARKRPVGDDDDDSSDEENRDTSKRRDAQSRRSRRDRKKGSRENLKCTEEELSDVGHVLTDIYEH